MSAGRMSRFMKLERTRKEPPAGGANAGNAASSRFDALEEARSSAVPSTSPVNAPRFGPGQAEARLEVHEARPEDQPFARCARCEADNNAFADRCFQCGEDLRTPEQLAYNERLWARRREEAEQERKALEELKRGRARAEAEEVDARRRLGVALATQVELQTRRRLDQEDLQNAGLRWGWGRRWEARFGHHDLEARLWERIPVAVRQVVVLLFVGVPLLLLLFRGTRPFAWPILFVAGFVYLRIWLERG